MKLHPRIEELSNLLQELSPNELTSQKGFLILRNTGATATEAAIALHLCFNIPEDEADSKVRSSGIFPTEEINDIAYQTFTYLYYD